MLEFKICNKCGDEKSLNEFVAKRNNCKLCRNKSLKAKKSLKPKKEKVTKEHKLQKIKEWQKNNPDKRASSVKKYNYNHKSEARNYYYDNRETIIYRVKQYKIYNREKVNQALRNKRKNITIKLRHYTSVLIRRSLRGEKYSIMKFLPYSIEELKQNIELLFEPWMNWQNWGMYNPNVWNDNDQSTWTWNIDHIIPQSKLPYASMEDDNFKKCWSLNNLRPLSSKENILKGNK
jgi:hypothetical protein